jgi:uncharacterized paraquat-inducible protein A
MGSIPVGVTMFSSKVFPERLVWSESRSTSIPVGVTMFSSKVFPERLVWSESRST